MECPVCYITTDNVDVFYDCRHLICCSCHEAWQFKQNTCPICRAPVDSPRTSYMVHAWCITNILIVIHVLFMNIFEFLFGYIQFGPEYDY